MGVPGPLLVSVLVSLAPNTAACAQSALSVGDNVRASFTGIPQTQGAMNPTNQTIFPHGRKGSLQSPRHTAPEGSPAGQQVEGSPVMHLTSDSSFEVSSLSIWLSAPREVPELGRPSSVVWGPER